MKRTLFGLAAVGALIAGPAMAADLGARMPLKAPPAPVPVCEWCGWYIGANVGGIWEHDTPTVSFADFGTGAIAAAAAGAIPLRFAYDRSGVIGGGQLGYNWQLSTFVVGIETDFDGTSLRGGQTISTAVPGFFPLSSGVTEKTDWLGTTRLRIGLPFSNVLLYGTGGAAYGDVHHTYFQNNVPGGGTVNIAASDSTTELGWTAGGGLEYKFGQWSIKGEALYYDLGTHNLVATSNIVTVPPTTFTTHFRDQGVIARAGVNYHFNWGGNAIATRY